MQLICNIFKRDLNKERDEERSLEIKCFLRFVYWRIHVIRNWRNYKFAITWREFSHVNKTFVT